MVGAIGEVVLHDFQLHRVGSFELFDDLVTLFGVHTGHLRPTGLRGRRRDPHSLGRGRPFAGGGRVQRRGTGLRDDFEVGEKGVAAFRREDGEDFRLELQCDAAGFFEGAAAGGEELNPMRAAIALMGLAYEEAGPLHAREGGGDGVRIACHETRDLLLGEAGGIAFAEPAQDGILARRDLEMADALPESLIKAVPRAAEKRRKAFRRQLFNVVPRC